ncbi:MAG: sulfite exporter TauE/SafE family protein [Gammaproteobacteria bacterium]|nr:sulfite exporter TauE/SafE family protein [Gammaproteobacteria bacterium]
MELLAYLITGAVAGLMAGLLGVGGGLVIVPALALLFAGHVADAQLMHAAVGTSLAAIVPTAIASLLAHHRRDSVVWTTVRALVPGIVVGGLGGAWLARQVSSPGLALFFGVFEILVALQLWFGVKPAAHRGLPGAAGMTGAGTTIGAVSALLGIGGGTLTTPFLLWNGVDIRRAVGTSAACGLPIALAGAAGFAVGDLSIMVQRGWATGFIYWPAVAGIVLSSVPLAPLGARLAHYLPRPVLQRLFSLFLLMVGLKMLLGSGL